MNYADRQLETALTGLFERKVTENRSTMRYWPAVSDRLGEQVSRRPWEYVMDAINKPRMPFNKQYIYTAGGALVVVIVALLLVVFLNTDDGSSGESVPADTPIENVPDADSEPAGGIPAPGPTPIVGLTVPGDLVPFEELGRVFVGFELHSNNLQGPSGRTSESGIVFGEGIVPTPNPAEIANRERLWNSKFAERRLKLLVFAPEADPFDQEDSTLSADDEGVIAVVSPSFGSELFFSIDDERLIVVEEFAMCGDGRGVYLEHSAKPVEVGETFAYEIYADSDDTAGDFHMVLIAEPDSPITHDGPDPKRLDIKWTPMQEVLTADIGVPLIGIFADGGAEVREMCG